MRLYQNYVKQLTLMLCVCMSSRCWMELYLMSGSDVATAVPLKVFTEMSAPWLASLLTFCRLSTVQKPCIKKRRLAGVNLSSSRPPWSVSPPKRCHFSSACVVAAEEGNWFAAQRVTCRPLSVHRLKCHVGSAAGGSIWCRAEKNTDCWGHSGNGEISSHGERPAVRDLAAYAMLNKPFKSPLC